MQYTLLKHTKEKDFHVDFLLDCGMERLLTWQIKNAKFFHWLTDDTKFLNFDEKLASSTDTIKISCQRIFDHQRKYLDFEGKLDNNRGFIEKIEWGKWDILSIEANQFVLKTIGVQKNIKIQIIKKWRLIFPVNLQHEIVENQWHNFQRYSTRFFSSFLPPVGVELWRLTCRECEKRPFEEIND
jgi:hypothetical protein